MSNNNNHILNLPPFTYFDVDLSAYSFFKKLVFIIKAKFLGFVVNNFNKNIFCFFINLFYKSDGKIKYQNNFYFKDLAKSIRVHYPNKRILRSVSNYQKHFKHLYDSYLFNNILFSEGDLIIDCGANVGEINIAFKLKDINVDYFAFEPDPESFKALLINNPESKKNLYQIGLSNKSGKSNFFMDSFGGNSSLIDFGSGSKIPIITARLDNYNFNKPVKVLKIDAEGFELEVLEGCGDDIRKIKYISVDYGAEKGESQDLTIIEVNNFLYDNNFKLIDFNHKRIIGLYKNNLMNDQI